MKEFYPLTLMMDFSDIPLFSGTWEKMHSMLFPDADDIYSVGPVRIEKYWDIIPSMELLIAAFSGTVRKAENLPGNVTIAGDAGVFTGANVTFSGSILLNCTKGPVIIADNTHITNFSVIEGPAYIGRDNLIDNALIRGPVITGSVCKLSGEIEECFIMDYVNKHHYGFLGHSILENWVNLGAGTTNSDLKNNYSNVRMYDGEKYADSGNLKLGCIIGQHSKTAIGTMINTGTVIGPFCNVFGNMLRVKNMQPFSWGNEDYRFELGKLLELVNTVMKRRNVKPSEEYLQKIRDLYSVYNQKS